MISSLISSLRFIYTARRLPLRDRYWVRPDGRLRLRYTCLGYGTLTALLTFSVLSNLPPMEGDFSTPIPPLAAAASASPAPPLFVAPAVIARSDDEGTLSGALSLHRDSEGHIRRDPKTRNLTAMVQESEIARGPQVHRLTIAAGDTLSSLLVRAGLSSGEALGAIKALGQHIRPRDLKPGQTIDLHLDSPDGGSAPSFSRLKLTVDPVRSVEVKRGWGGFLSAHMVEKPLKQDAVARVAVVRSSLFGSADAAGIPTSVTTEAIRAFAHQVDFQRELQPGDRLEVLYDRYVTDDGFVARPGHVMFARLKAAGKDLAIYRFESRDGRVDYYDRQGRSIRKALLRTPMDGARISSGFGMRRHPILGFSKMHKGVDFAASTGTPILAAGDGIVDKAGRFGAYGNYVRLRHTGNLKTAYAHMSRYGKGIQPGARVRQGQVIGYVGTTGRSTGAHLHYEVMVSNAQINPLSVRLPTMVSLEGRDLRAFRDMAARLDQEFKAKSQGIKFASADGGDLVKSFN